MNELALFAGAGGGILGGQLLGWRTVCAVERDAYAAAILAQRQNDGLLDLFPIWSDITTFDGRPWRSIVDIVSGGFPCQEISVAGSGEGIDGARSGLWNEQKRVVREVRPLIVWVENSPALTLRGLGRVLGDLAEMGYDAEWGVLGASDVGAPHKRERIWILAYSECVGLERWNDSDKKRQRKIKDRPVSTLVQSTSWPDVSNPRTFGDCHGVAFRMDRLKAIGNGQVPQCAAEAWRRLMDRLTK